MLQLYAPKQRSMLMPIDDAFPWGTFWSVLSALATVVSATAIVFAAQQLKFQAWLKVQEIWTADRDLRNWVFTKKGPYSAGDMDQARDACRRLDEFAHLANYLGPIPWLGTRTTLKVWGEPIAKLWLLLEPVVLQERAGTRWEKKWQAFEKLGSKAIQYTGITKLE